MTSIAEKLIELGIRLPKIKPGENYTTCPKCSVDRRKSRDTCLSVRLIDGGPKDTRALIHCNHCGWHDWVGIGRWANVKLAQTRAYRRPDIKPIPPDEFALNWLATRGIDADTATRAGVFGAMVLMPQSTAPGKKERCICFPITRDGVIVNVKYREPVNKWFRQIPDAEPLPFGFDTMAGALDIIITEGEVDALSVMMIGRPGGTISVPAGAGLTEVADDSPKFAWLDLCYDHLAAAKRVIIAVDSDAAGRVLERELIRRIGHEKCWVVQWPANKDGEVLNDANAVHMVLGLPAVAAAIDAARAVPVAGEITIHDKWSEIAAKHRGKTVQWFSTGLPGLDEHYRVLRGQVTVVTGYPNDGKSNALDQIVVNMALQYGWKFMISSPETEPDDHMINILEKAARKPFFEGPTERMSLPEADSYKAWVGQHFHWVSYPRVKGGPPRGDMAWIEGQIDYCTRRYGIDGAILDPYSRIYASAQGGGFQRETDFVLDVIDRLQYRAKQLDIHIWLVAHPQKLSRDKNGKRPEELTLNDISGSAHWDDCPDMGLLVRRVWTDGDTTFQGRDTPVEVKCLKARHKHSGQKNGKQRYRYNAADGRLLSMHEWAQGPSVSRPHSADGYVNEPIPPSFYGAAE